MSSPLSFFLGAATSYNVRHLATNIDWMLSNSGPIHLISTEPDTYAPITHSFDLYGGDCTSSIRGEIAALRGYLSKHKPAVLVELTRPPVHGTLCGLATRPHDVPFVYRYSGDRFAEYRVARGKRRITSFSLGKVLGRVPLFLADEYVTLGPNGTERLADRGVDTDRITVLPPSVDVTRFESATDPPSDISSDHSLALFVGRLSRLKGIKTLERTLPTILDQRPDIKVMFIGDGEATLTLPERHRDKVMFLGPVEPTKLPAYFHRADLLVHPSLTEGIPRVILESLASGTPVIARDVSDVASVTANTFTTDEEFAEMVLNYESLAIDDVTPFTRETLQPTYQRFFESFRGL